MADNAIVLAHGDRVERRPASAHCGASTTLVLLRTDGTEITLGCECHHRVTIDWERGPRRPVGTRGRGGLTVARTEAEIRAEIAPLRKRLDVLLAELTRVVAKNTAAAFDATFADGITLARIMTIDWMTLDRAPGRCYRALTDWLDKNRPPGTYNSGCVPDAGNQVAMKIAFDHHQPRQPQIDGVKSVIPLIRPWECGWKYMSIFEWSLSAGGSYALWIKGDRHVITRSWSMKDGDPPPYRAEVETKSLDDALDWIWTNRPYQHVDMEDK